MRRDAELAAYAARYIAKQIAYMRRAPGEDREGYDLALSLAERGGNKDEIRQILGLSSLDEPSAPVRRWHRK